MTGPPHTESHCTRLTRSESPHDAGSDEASAGQARTLTAWASRIDAPLVGLGEATHGSRAFTVGRGRLTRALLGVNRDRRGASDDGRGSSGDGRGSSGDGRGSSGDGRGSNDDGRGSSDDGRESSAALALEAGAARVARLNRYVTHGEGELAAALGELPPFWRTVSFAGVCRRLRASNRDRPPSERIRVYGVDVDDPGRIARRLRDRCRRIAPDDSVPEPLDRLAATDGSLAGAVPDERVERTRRAAERTADWLADRGADDGEFARAERFVGTLRRTVEWLSTGGATASFEPAAMGDRDRVMAEETAWCVRAHERTVLWAHNVHVQREQFAIDTAWRESETTGERLARTFGAAYHPIGTDFVGGGLRALTPSGERRRTVWLDEPLAGSVAAWVHGDDTAGEPFDPARESSAGVNGTAGDEFAARGATAVNLDRLGSTGGAAPGRVRSIGRAYDPDADRPYAIDCDLTNAFDHVIAFDRVEPERPFDPTPSPAASQ